MDRQSLPETPKTGNPAGREAKVSAKKPVRTTRAFVTDRDFAAILAGDFPRLSESVILDSLFGHPKKAAIELCAWAERAEEPNKALKRWAEKRRPNRQKAAPTDAQVKTSGDFFDAMMARKRERLGSVRGRS